MAEIIGVIAGIGLGVLFSLKLKKLIERKGNKRCESIKHHQKRD